MTKEKKKHITKTSQFNLVHSKGRFCGSNLVIMKTLPNGLDYHRYGFVVSKKIGKAVTRNRVKRLLREVMRQTPVKAGWDIVFIARNGIEKHSFKEIEKTMRGMVKRARLLTENNETDCISLN